MAKPYRARTVKAIRARSKKGQSEREIAKELGISRAGVWGVLNR